MARNSSYYYSRASINFIVCVINAVATVWGFNHDSNWAYMNLTVAIIAFVFMCSNLFCGFSRSYDEEVERTRRYLNGQ